MENKIITFENEEFGSVRTMLINGEPVFVANDVCRVLDIQNPKDAVRNMDSDEKLGVDIADPHGRVQTTNCITEAGLYSLILRSRKPKAKNFRRWVTHEVIPAIRQNGMYATENTLRMLIENPALIYEMAQEMLRQRQRADGLSLQIELLRPKAEYFDQFVSPTDCTNIRNTAKELGVPERRFCKFLVREKLLYRCPAGNLMPYNKHKNEGLFIVRDFYGKNGHFGAYTLITPMGKDHIRVLLLNTEI